MNLDLVTWFLVFARAGALMAIFPLFSGTNVPVQIRVALAALVAFLSSPFLAAPEIAPDLPFWGLTRLLFVEVSVGLLLGFMCRLVFFAIDLAGGMVATEIGLMLSSTFNPLTSGALPVPGMILFWLAMILLLTLNLHHWLIAAFQHTYALVPAGGAHLSEGLLQLVIHRSGRIFRVALEMTAPVMAVSFMVTMIFSILSRAVPQMNVFAESFAVRSLAGLTVFGLTCHLMAQHIENFLRRLPEDLVRVSSLLGAGG